MKKNIINFFKKKETLSFILAFMAFIGFYTEEIIPYYNPISWLLFVIILMLYNRVTLYDKNYFKSSITFAIIFSFLLILGKTTYQFINNATINIWSEFAKIRHIISIISFGTIFYTVFINLLPKLVNYNMTEGKTNSKKIFWISFFTIFICWIPYFLAMYPGLLSADSFLEMGAVTNNLSTMTNHHPVFHQLFIFVFYKLGMFLFNDINKAVAVSSIAQMVTMSLIFASFIKFLSQRKVNKIFIILAILYFALLPNHAYYSVTMWKDVIFSGLTLLLLTKLITLCDNKNHLEKKDLIHFAIISLLTLLFRNNAVYAYFVLVIFMCFIFKKQIKKLSIVFGIVICTYFIIVGPIFSLFKIEKSASSEYIGIPLQQIGRMAYKDTEFTIEERILIDNLIGVQKMKELYNPVAVDFIKFNDSYRIDVFNENKGRYFNLWLNLVLKHFDIATESYAASTIGYWYPGVEHWSVLKEVDENTLGIETTRKGLNPVNYILYRIESRKLPLLNMIWSTSLALWIITIFAYVCVKKRGITYLTPYIFIFGIWLTMMLAAPVYAEYRYIYSEYTTLPLLLLVPYLVNKKNVSKN